MTQISTNEFKPGVKIEIDGQPYVMVTNQFVKPGKGNAFNRTKLKNLVTGRVVEKTYKSGEKVEVADVFETQMRLLYTDTEGAVFMDDNSFEQCTIPLSNIGDNQQWLKDDIVYATVFHKGEPITIEPPTFMELVVEQTDPGVKGDTASGRVLKPAVLETGAKVQIPIFIDQGEVIKVDTRTGEYVSRAGS